MKKSLLALAVLGAFAGVASAQSTVTLFGVVDVNARSVKNDGAGTRKTLSTDGINSSRLGFRGTEDLGGGLSANFWLEGGLQPDDGTTSKLDFRRRSYVGLKGGFGEVQAGREYTPTFWNTTIFDPFGTNGVGSSINITHNVGQLTYIRASNMINYLLPALGGLYGQVMVAAGEGGGGKYVGGRIGFAAGPFDIAGAVGRQDIVAGGSSKFEHANIAGSFDFGVAKVMAQYNNETVKSGTPDFKESRILLGVVAPLGQGELHAAYTRTDEKSRLIGAVQTANRDASQLAVGYNYFLSKRTALYGTFSRLDNKLGSQFAIGGGPGVPTSGGNSTGLEFGLRHSF